MNELARTLAGIIRLRSGPQDLQASWPLTAGLVAAYLALGAWSGKSLGDEDSAAATLALTAVQFTAVYVMLQLRKYPERLAQTLGALAGVGIIFGLLSFVFLSQADPTRNQPLLALAWFGIFFWSLVIDAHIYRNALSITMAQGMLMAVLLLAASYVLIEWVFNTGGIQG
jgi:hypothetical protein